MSQIVGDIIVRFGAESSTFRMELDRTNAALRQAGQSWQASIGKLPRATKAASQQAASDFRRIGQAAQESAKQVEKTEGTITRLTATRALTRGLTGKPSITSAERFLGDYLNLGSYAKAIFPVTGGLAVGVLLGEFVDKIQKFKAAMGRINMLPQALADGFRKVNLPLQEQNDELDAANAKLSNEIAKLQGKPANGLAQALADARVMADKLAISLDNDLTKAQDLLKQNSTGFLGTLMGVAGTDDIQKQLAEFRRNVNAVQDNGLSTIHALNHPSGAGPGHPLGIVFKGSPEAVNVSTGKQTIALYDAEIQKLTRQLQEARADRIKGLDITGTGAGSFAMRPEARIAAITGLLRQLRQERVNVAELNRNAQLTQQKNALAARSAAAAGPAGFRMTADMRARLNQYLEQQRALAEQTKRMHELEMQFEQDQQRRQAATAKTLAQIQARTAALKNLTDAVGLSQQAQRNAVLENIRNEGTAAGEDPAVVAARVKQQQAKFALEDAQNKTVDWTKGGMKGGAYQFFAQMNDNIQTTAQNVNTVLGGAFDGLSATMSRVIDGQRGAWSSFFFGLARQFSSIGLNKIFGMFSGFALGKLSGGLSPMSLGGSGGLLSALGAVSMPAFASGGYSPGGPILVGENGPEIISSRPGDYITPNGKLGSPGAMYYIDARGTNGADVEARVHRALVAVHGQAVQNAVAVQKEIRARSPRSKFQP